MEAMIICIRKMTSSETDYFRYFPATPDMAP